MQHIITEREDDSRSQAAQSNPSSSSKQGVSKREFIAALSKSVSSARSTDELLGDRWYVFVALRRARSTYLSTLLLVLFLIHAPISQRLTMFFACHEISGKRYLRAE